MLCCALTGAFLLQRGGVGSSRGAYEGRAWLEYPPRRLRRMLRDACARDERRYVPYTHYTGGFTGKTIHLYHGLRSADHLHCS